ncbi:MAG: response regulator transcription factor, partial [Cyanobacteria bacterium SZAS LIN-5]|nr:response regulator transcription factor [Cyanobacteria bacterium SZAS LIN-5]
MAITFVSTGDEALNSYKIKKADLIVLDLKAADAEVFEAAASMWLHNPQAKIIFLADSYKEWHLRKIEKIVP